MASLNMFILSLIIFTLVLNLKVIWSSDTPQHVGLIPSSCSHIHCPNYEVIHTGNNYEIRRYNSTVWMSTSAIKDFSLVHATRTGFQQLFDYIQGKNNYKKKIEMTAPVMTEIFASNEPLSSFIASFYIAKQNQANPPIAKGLHIQKWKQTYAAVRQFSGFVSNLNVGQEIAALHTSISGSVWADAIDKSHGAKKVNSGYIVSQYNSPFEYDNRVNEIWLKFDM